MKNVLVVIDLQEGFINDKTVKVANNIRDLLDSEKYYAVIATKFTNMPGSSFDSFLGWTGMMEEEEKKPCYRLLRNMLTLLLINARIHV